MLLSLNILFEYSTEQVTFGLLCVMFRFSSRMFCKGVSGFATGCPCDVWYRALTTCLLYVGPLLGNLVWSNSRFVNLTKWINFHCFSHVLHIGIMHHNMIILYFHYLYSHVSNSASFFLQSTMVLSWYINVVLKIFIRQCFAVRRDES